MDDVIADVNPNPLTAHYKLGDGIDARPSWDEGPDACASYDGNTVPASSACTGWDPIGDNSTSSDASRFTGSLDGDDYVIRNLYVNISDTTGAQYGGLFGYLGNSAAISNLGLTDASITATSGSDDANAGGLAGRNNGSITNSYATGSVSSTDDSGARASGGGLAGRNDGSITNSYATGSVESSSISNASGGGLVGQNSGGIISNSFATGRVESSVSGIFGTNVSSGGGLAGWSSGTISNSYATGSVSSTDGGGSSSSSSGGLAGWSSGTISASYWATGSDGTGQDDGCDSDTNCGADVNNAEGLTTAQMQDGMSAALGLGFKLTDGEYPKAYQCTTCTDGSLG